MITLNRFLFALLIPRHIISIRSAFHDLVVHILVQAFDVLTIIHFEITADVYRPNQVSVYYFSIRPEP